MIGKIVCFFARKHLRGKLLRRVQTEKTAGGQSHYIAHYGCPRCGAEWTRKVKRIEGAQA